jgi:hypothetical protein
MDAVTMPAKDRYHADVVRALIKDGWTITDEQVAVILGERRLWIDIEAVKASQRLAILVEVKGFEHMPSPVDVSADAVGRYVLYRAALDYGEVDTPLFLAVPTAAYEGILNEDIGRQAIAKAGMNLIIFDPLKEEISLWIR